jgi:hypothetical protein
MWNIGRAAYQGGAPMPHLSKEVLDETFWRQAHDEGSHDLEIGLHEHHAHSLKLLNLDERHVEHLVKDFVEGRIGGAVRGDKVRHVFKWPSGWEACVRTLEGEADAGGVSAQWGGVSDPGEGRAGA